MAAHVVITDFSLQQRKVSVIPSKPMSDVRNEACMRMRDDASNYGLKHNGKIVDLSRTFRQSGLTSGAKLELVAVSKSPSVVTVALQHPDIPRQTDKVPSNTTLWLILRKFESDPTKNINITARGVAQIDNGASGRMYYEAPVVRILNREYTELEDLQKTLAQIGVNSGSVVLFLRYRKTDMPLEAAMSQIGGYFQEVAGDMTNSAQAKNTPENTSAKTAAPVSPSPSSTQPPKQSPRQRGSSPPAPAIPEPTTTTPDDGDDDDIEVFAAPTGTVPLAARSPFDEAAYEPTIADAKRHQLSLEQRTKNQRLLSDAELAAKEEEKRSRKEAVKETVIRVRFPDEESIKVKITVRDTGASLYTKVRRTLVENREPFWLVYRGAKPNMRVADSDSVKLMKDLGFDGPTVINFIWQEGASEQAKKGPALKEEYRNKAKPLPVPQISTPALEEGTTEAETSEAPKDKPKDERTSEEKMATFKQKFLGGKKNLFGGGKK